MLQLKQKKPLPADQIKGKAGQAFRANMFRLMGATFCNLILVYAALFLRTQLTGGRISNSMLQTGLDAVVVILIFPLQMGLVRYCTLTYLRGAAQYRELLHYYRHYFANNVFMALAVVFISVAIQQLTLLVVNLAAGAVDENITSLLGIVFPLGLIFYLMLRLCVSPWLFIENPVRSTIQIFEYSFRLTREKNRQTLRFFWWAPVALIVVLFLVGFFSGAGNLMFANIAIIVGAIYIIPRLLVGLSGYIINMLTVDKVSRPKAGGK
ncbi:MAG: hypothetical protein LBS10_00055 [Gracilibacteraceae bacterium]|jgi:hypothetical protein|nr:hypothetical protein [Gracilibacteraceae bacterium]